MPREIVFLPEAARQLARIGATDARRVRAKIGQLAADPASLANNVTALTGSAFKRLRVGDYRVIFDEDLKIVRIVKVGHRSRVYD